MYFCRRNFSNRVTSQYSARRSIRQKWPYCIEFCENNYFHNLTFPPTPANCLVRPGPAFRSPQWARISCGDNSVKVETLAVITVTSSWHLQLGMAGRGGWAWIELRTLQSRELLSVCLSLDITAGWRWRGFICQTLSELTRQYWGETIRASPGFSSLQ